MSVAKRLKYVEMLVEEKSMDIPAGESRYIVFICPHYEAWTIQYTNSIGSGADITLNRIEVSPDRGMNWYPVSQAHIDWPLFISPRNAIRALFTNSGTDTETAYFRLFGSKETIMEVPKEVAEREEKRQPAPEGREAPKVPGLIVL